MAFACNPQLLIADEPTTALDVTVQAQVLALIRERALARGTAVLFITHDLAVVSQLCTRVYVMYAGQIVECGDTEDVLRRPHHPYTRALLRSLPESAVPGAPLPSITGTVPGLLRPPTGCRFRARCDMSQERCGEPSAVLDHGRTEAPAVPRAGSRPPHSPSRRRHRGHIHRGRRFRNHRPTRLNRRASRRHWTRNSPMSGPARHALTRGRW